MDVQYQFSKYLENYLNVDLRIKWKYEDTFNVFIILDVIYINLNKNIIASKHLSKILSINKYKDAFIKRLDPSVKSVLKTGSWSLLVFDDGNIKIIPKIIPEGSTLIDVLPDELVNIMFSYVEADDIEIFIDASIKDYTYLYTNIIRNIDIQITKGRLWKWICPRDKFDKTEYEELRDLYDKLPTLIIKYVKKINRTKKHYNKPLLEFLLDINTNFDEDNGYLISPDIKISNTYVLTPTIPYINIDNKWVELVKMRQFYPHFIGCNFERYFAHDLYHVKSLIVSMPRDTDNIDGSLLHFINTGDINDENILRNVCTDYRIHKPTRSTSHFALAILEKYYTKYTSDCLSPVNILHNIYDNYKDLLLYYKHIMPKNVYDTIRNVYSICKIKKNIFSGVLAYLYSEDMDLIVNPRKEIAKYWID
jgi:hypothetical protein